MRFTGIRVAQGEGTFDKLPYNPELLKILGARRGEDLSRKREQSSIDPFAFASSEDIPIILFGPEDRESFLFLPLSTNSAKVYNKTSYGQAPKINFIRRRLLGERVTVTDMRLDSFVNGMGEVEILDMPTLEQTYKRVQHPDDRDLDYGYRLIDKHEQLIRAGGRNQEEWMRDMRQKFTSYFDYRFELDPASIVKVERITTQSVDMWSAVLSVAIETGLSGVPGITDKYSQVLRVATKKD